MAERYWLSNDGEYYNVGPFPSKELATEAALSNEFSDYPKVYLGTESNIEINIFPQAEKVLEECSESLYVEIGDITKDWLDKISESNICELDAVIEKAILDYLKENNLLPNYLTIIDVEEITRNS